MTRWTLFFLVMIISLGAGLYYGWVINPVEYEETSLQTLRMDYKTDYTLMVAEVYKENLDITWAMNRLELLGFSSPTVCLENTLAFASKAGYTLPDLYLLRDLKNALEESK